MIFDACIIGAGPAGLSAAIYCSRLGLKTIVLEKGAIGGKLAEIPILENYPGFPDGIRGIDLAEFFYRQALRFGAEIIYPTEAVSISLKDNLKIILTRSGEKYIAKTLIITTGLEKARIKVPGEGKFSGRGVSYCAVCDASLYKDKVIALIGSIERTAEEALYLINIVKKVYWIPDSESFDVPEHLINRVLSSEKVEIIPKGKLISIEGENAVEAIKVMIENETKVINVNAVFVAKGDIPSTTLFEKVGLKIDKRGFVITDNEQKTNIPGIYAAGDCTGRGFQVATAVGDGVVAALSAYKYIKQVYETLKTS